MSIVPSTNIGKLTFYESHIATWTGLPTQIGLLPSDCLALATLITTARKAYNDQQAQLESSRAATQAMKNAIAAMHTLGAADIAKIKAFAEATNNPGVFPLANIPAPATPTPVGPPGTPTDFTAGIEPTGAVTLRWKCPNPVGGGGTVYEVQRKIGSGNFAVVGIIGTRSFTDSTLPSGSTGVMYQITAIRTTVRGTPNIFVVNFGVGGGGGMFIASTSEGMGGTGEMKMAA